MAKKQPEASVRNSAIGWAKSIGGALIIWLVLRTLLIGAFHITSGSMENTLLIGDVLFVNKALYGAQIPIVNKRIPGFRDPRRGDVVVFDSAEEPGLTVVKRIIGAPGDTVEMQENRVYLNGLQLDESYAVLSEDPVDPSDAKMRAWQTRYLTGDGSDTYEPTLKNWGPLVVPPDSFLVLGDNRDFSYDGRYWGFLGGDRIGGKAVILYFSFDKNGILPLPFITAIRWSRLFDLIR